MHFQEPVLTCNVALHDKSRINPFYKSESNTLNLYKNIRIFYGCEVRIETLVRGSLFVITRLCRVMPSSDPEGRIFLSAPKNHDRFFFLHTLRAPSFDLNVGAVINESYSCTLTSTILNVDVVCDVAMT